MVQRRRSTRNFRAESAPGHAKKRRGTPPKLKHWGGDSDVMELRYDSTCMTCGCRLRKGGWAHCRSKKPWRFECVACDEDRRIERANLREQLLAQVRAEKTEGGEIRSDHPLLGES